MNLHTIRDQPNSDRRLQQQRNNPQNVEDNGSPWDGFSPVVSEEQIRYAEQNRVILVSGSRKVKNPRDENYWDMLVSTFCPTFNCLSITIFLVLADIGMFIASLAIGLYSQGSFLEITTSALRKLGANYGPDVSNGEVYRLVSAIFLHINFIHIVGNILSTFILVTRVEYTLRPFKTIVIYLMSGIGGNIFSLAVSSGDSYTTDVKAGASTALYGMIGLLIGYIILNWNGLDFIGQQLKCNIICMTTFMLIFVLLFTPSTVKNSIDYYGHLGGFLTGIWMIAIDQPLVNETREKIIRGVFVILLVIQLAATFAGFYASHAS